jgi:CBS domain-containing protein
VGTSSVAAVMHKGVISCRPETPLSKIAQMMAAHRIHSVVVWSEADEADADGTLWGVVSDFDLARAIAAGAPRLTAEALTSAPAVTIGPDASVRKAAEVMVGSRVTHLVVAKRGRPVGVVSTLDLARALADRAS